MAFNGQELSENSISYHLYPKLDSLKNTLDQLKDYTQKCNEYNAYIAKHLAPSDHIWHIQGFHLSVSTDSSGVHHLSGVTNFGDNIEDEWLIVYLLYRLSHKYPELVIRVEDTDGEFLLIESADYLPKWCDPSNCQHRVFIHQNALHIIPIKCREFPDGSVPAIPEAVAYVRKNHTLTKAQDLIQKSIRRRIDCFPERITQWQHRTHAYVPAGVAALLRDRPALIAWAVQAFYNRTPDELRVCQAMKYFPPESRVMRCLTITRCLYAQLMSQQYTPDARVGWQLPPKNSRDFRSHDLGMKIASGFEILISQSRAVTASNGSAPNEKPDMSADRRWQAFQVALTKNGYFGAELKGSRKYRELEKSAQNYFQELLYNNDNSLTNFGSKGDSIYNELESLTIDDKVFEEEAKHLPPEDSDDWLTLSADELDAMLSEKFCSKPNQQKQSNDCSEVSRRIPTTLKAFVGNQRSGLKGAEAPKPPPRTRRKAKGQPSTAATTSTAAHRSATNKIHFQEDSFADALSTVLSLKIPHSETDSSSSGMSDYSDGSDSIDSDDDCYQNELFTKANPKNNNNSKTSHDSGTNGLVDEMKEYMKAMDEQLADTSVGRTFERRTDGQTAAVNGNGDYKGPMDIDFNALTNILESYSAECGVPGPATALFGTMGVKLPEITNDSDDDSDP